MARRRPVLIDGDYRVVSSEARLSDVVQPGVSSVLSSDGAVIPRSEFARHAVPDGFETNLAPLVKG